ncbi:flagella basal body P-ring formation protein FlgA [Acidovorax facilis]|uniref:flagella basal body P-ring formation protein FlgA n=1 Tax=Acidovorax facilis TaxID=12917 RepID=UPI003CEDD660
MKRVVSLCLAVALSLISTASVAQLHATISMHDKVKIPANQPVRLGEIATINTTDLALIRRLLQIRVAPARSAGNMTHIQRTRLEHQFVNQGAQIRWSGAENTEISFQSKSVDAGDIILHARNHLVQSLNELGRVAGFIELISDPATPWIARDGLTLRSRPLPYIPASGGRVTVLTDITSGGNLLHTAVTVFEVPSGHGAPDRYQQPQAIGSSAIPQNAKDMYVQPPSIPVQEDQSVANSRSILVPKGAPVTLVSQVGNVVVETQVHALQNGYLGKAIQVKVRGTREVLHARVTSAVQVETIK